MSGVNKLAAERNQRVLLELVSKPGNDVCADCKARVPRWASHNLGVFICMNCASIHRKIGTHITKVKSVTMDSWSREQVEVMKSIGNVASNAKYNPNEARHPPPANREESERDSELEKFIRWKYEFKRFMEKPSDTPASKAPPPRAQSTPAMIAPRERSPVPPVPTSQPSHRPAPDTRPYSAVPSQSQLPRAPPTVTSYTPPAPAPTHAQPAVNPPSSNPVWNDMMSLANPSVSSMSGPSQTQSHFQPSQQQFQPPSFAPASGPTNLNPYGTPTPTNPFPSNFMSSTPSRSASLPVPPSLGSSFQSQPSMGNPFHMPQQQQPTGFPGQMSTSPFQPSGAMPIQSPFGQIQPSQSPFSHSYTPPSSFSQHQQQQQQFAPSSFPGQQFTLSPFPQQQQPQFPQQAGGNPFGTPMQWQQQQQQPQPTGYPGQQQYGQWGGM